MSPDSDENKDEMVGNATPPASILVQIEQRNEARKIGNYILADEIQKEVSNQGWTVQEKKGIVHCIAKKRSNVRAEDNNRRKATRRKQSHVRKKKARFSIFADFVMETFVSKAEEISKEGGDDVGYSIIDVAGGKARLTLEFTLERNIPSTVVDPCTTRLSAFTTRRLANLALEWKESGTDVSPILNTNDVAPSTILHQEEIERMELDGIQRTEDYLRWKGFAIHKCLFNAAYIKDNPVWDRASIVLGMHPDEATEDIVDFALRYDKPFAVVPCCVFPSLFPNRTLASGEPVRSVGEFITYLVAKHPDILCTTLTHMAGNNVVVYKL